MEDLEFNFNTILNKIMKKERAAFCVHSDTNNRERIDKNISKLLSSLETSFGFFKMDTTLVPNEEIFEPYFKKEFYLLPNYVNYVIQSFEIPNYYHADIPKIAVMSLLIR